MKAKDQGLEIELYVYRRLDNRLEHLPDDSPPAYELHLLRKKALHEALGGVEGLSIDWFQADDTTSHELAELWLSVSPHIHTAVVAGMTLFAGELAKAAISEFAKKAASIVIDPLIRQAKGRKDPQLYAEDPRRVHDFGEPRVRGVRPEGQWMA